MATAAELALIRAPLLAFLQSTQSIYTRVDSDGGSVSQMTRKEAQEALDRIDARISRSNAGGMMLPGRVEGLR